MDGVAREHHVEHRQRRPVDGVEQGVLEADPAPVLLYALPGQLEHVGRAVHQVAVEIGPVLEQHFAEEAGAAAQVEKRPVGQRLPVQEILQVAALALAVAHRDGGELVVARCPFLAVGLGGLSVLHFGVLPCVEWGAWRPRAFQGLCAAGVS